MKLDKVKLDKLKLNNSAAVLFLGFCILQSCGSSNSDSNSPTGACASANTSCTSAAGPNAIPTSSNQSIPLYLADSSTTGQYGYQNEPLVSVTICTPNHTSSSQCQTISNILLDTGSSGLRIFGSAINSNVQLTQQAISTNLGNENLAECTVFGTGADWGAIQNGDVMMGGQTASNIPIQVININYASLPSGCASLCPDTDPCTAGYNGILGVGPFVPDCGSTCTSQNDQVNPGIYFGCDGSGCYDADEGNCGSDQTCMYTVAPNQQVSNPVASFSSYNNGISIELPNISASGASAVSGTFTLGVTSPTGVAGVYPMDPSGLTDGNYLDFNTTFEGTLYGYQSSNDTTAFLDSGSNLFFLPANISTCSGSSLFCPSSTQNLSATVAGYHGSPSNSVSFSIGNAASLTHSGNSAFNNLGGTSSSSFDWGLPFFFNRTVYVGFDGSSATINSSSITGPYWAF
jgi:hypothetical protein